MSDGYVMFSEQPINFLKDDDEVELVNTYNFEDDIFAGHIRTDKPFDIKADPRVEDLHKNIKNQLAIAPEKDQHELQRANPVTMDDVYNIHNISDEHNGKGTTVVIMDSGVDVNHPVFDDAEFKERVDVTGEGVGDRSGHGTGTAGLVHQIAPEAELISLKIFTANGSAPTSVIMDAYEWLINNAEKYDIVNMSWGSGGRVKHIDQIHQKMLNKNIIDCIASGNSGEKGGSPGTSINAFSVGSININQKVSNFSSYNPNRENPDVSATGEDVVMPSASNGSMGRRYEHGYIIASGTSFSAPIVSGMIACSLEHFDDDKYKREKIKSFYERNARNIAHTPRDGHGIVNFEEVHQAIEQS